MAVANSSIGSLGCSKAPRGWFRMIQDGKWLCTCKILQTASGATTAHTFGVFWTTRVIWWTDFLRAVQWALHLLGPNMAELFYPSFWHLQLNWLKSLRNTHVWHGSSFVPTDAPLVRIVPSNLRTDITWFNYPKTLCEFAPEFLH